jgi:signal transduction histidine kinase
MSVQIDMESLLSNYDPDAVRLIVARSAELDGQGGFSLYRILDGNRLSRFDAEGREQIMEGKGLPRADGGAPEQAAGSELLPIELHDSHLWGYWSVPAPELEAARRKLPALTTAIRHLDHLEDDLRLRETNEALWSIFGLGHVLGQAEEPGEMASAIHGVCRRVLGARLTGLVLLSQGGGRIYRCEGEGTPESYAGRPESWLDAFPRGRESWGPAAPEAKAAAELLHTEPGAGMLQSIGDRERPGAYLLVLGEAPFSERENGLFARIGDFLFAGFVRWEQLEGVRRKSRQVSELFVMLAQEKERLDYVMRSVPVGILLADADGGIALSNETAAKALGLTHVELRENRIFAGRQAGQALLGLIRKAKAEERMVSTPYQMESRWFQVQVVPWPGGSQFLVVTQDIEEWFSLNRLKEDLISIISHEVKNPLTAIINAADLISTGRPGPLNPAQERMAALISENGKSIRSILDDVVRLSRIHHGGGAEEQVPLDELLDRIRASSSDTIQGKLVTWRQDFENVSVTGDPRMLENLFTNLIGNAIKYVGIGGYVGVRLKAEAGRVAVRVMDDGPGIPEDERRRLFTPFFRASNVRDLVTGTGLGLVIAKNIAERMGGTLEAVSPIEREDLDFLRCPKSSRPGTAFQVVLPVSE